MEKRNVPGKKESGQGTGGFQAGRRRMLFWKKKRGPLSCLVDMNHGKTENKLKEAALPYTWKATAARMQILMKAAGMDGAELSRTRGMLQGGMVSCG
jgi:hypothetical protein